MIYPAIAIANAFIKKAMIGEIQNLTPMKLQKLMFFAQSWHCKLYAKELFDGAFERWQYGPVIPEIYHEFKSFGSREISRFGTDVWCQERTVDPNDSEVLSFLDKIIQTYGKYDGAELSWMTHQPQTAWSMGEIGTVISKKELYQGKV